VPSGRSSCHLSVDRLDEVATLFPTKRGECSLPCRFGHLQPKRRVGREPDQRRQRSAVTRYPVYPAETAKPVRAVTCTAGPPSARQITGRPAAIASAQTHPPESCRLGMNQDVTLGELREQLVSRHPFLEHHGGFESESHHGLLDVARSGPSPTIQYSLAGTCSCKRSERSQPR
jgi:hypothetical protein